MSQPSSSSPQAAEAPQQKQKLNVYTVMLFISFWAIFLACVILYWELQSWGDFMNWWRTSEAIPKGAFHFDELIRRTADIA